MLLMVDQQLGGSFNRAIRHRIVRGESLLKPSGPFLPEDRDDFLDVLEVLADMADRGLVDRESLDFWYGDLIARTAQHPEVRAHIRQQQAKSPDTYTGLEDLAKTLPKPSSGSMIRRTPPSP
jgi:hypothetical protein